MMRITISLEEEVDKKVKELQKVLVERTGRPISVAKTINALLIAGILSTSRLHVVEWNKIREFIDGKDPDLSDFDWEEFIVNTTAISQWI